MQESKKPLIIVFFTVFLDMLGFGILIPVLPLLLADPRSPYFLLPSGMSLNDGFILYGFLTAIFPLMQFLATPILGQLSDKYGRKKILAISLAGTCISYILFAVGIITKNIPLLFISRGFDGITGGNISVAMAAIADITKPQDRAKNFGLIGAAFGLGFIIGPYIGGKLSDPTIISWFDATTPFWFAAILSFLNVSSVILFFPETLHKAKDITIRWAKSVQDVIHAYSTKGLRSIFSSSFLYTAGFTFFTTFASVYFINKFGFRQSNIGDLFAYVGLWIAISQAVVTRYVSSRYSEKQIMRISLIGTAFGILGQFMATEVWQLWLIIPFFAIFNGLTMANLTALVSKSADKHMQGEILGISSSVQSLAQAIPPILSGYIAASLKPESPLLVSSIVIFVSGIVFWIFYKDVKKPLTIEDVMPSSELNESDKRII